MSMRDHMGIRAEHVSLQITSSSSQVTVALERCWAAPLGTLRSQVPRSPGSPEKVFRVRREEGLGISSNLQLQRQ